MASPRAASWPRALRVSDWPIAVKMTALCTVIAALLSIALTGIGYVQASAGLTAQAEAAIGADGRLVQTSIDDWHAQRLAVRHVGADMDSVQRIAEQGALASAADRASARAALAGFGQGSSDLESVGIMNSSGTFVLATDPATQDVSSPQRDYFQQAVAGRDFIFRRGGLDYHQATGPVSLGPDQEPCGGSCRRAQNAELTRRPNQSRASRRGPPG